MAFDPKIPSDPKANIARMESIIAKHQRVMEKLEDELARKTDELSGLEAENKPETAVYRLALDDKIGTINERLEELDKKIAWLTNVGIPRAERALPGPLTHKALAAVGEAAGK